jgi:hypothetical protein
MGYDTVEKVSYAAQSLQISSACSKTYSSPLDLISDALRLVFSCHVGARGARPACRSGGAGSAVKKINLSPYFQRFDSFRFDFFHDIHYHLDAMAPKTLVKKASMYPLIIPRERLSIWEKARGMWKRRKPDPAKELKKMRKEWARKLSHTDK